MPARFLLWLMLEPISPPNYLFHYQRFDRKNDKRWLVDTLKGHRIYCSNPLDFNHPWDGKPHIRSVDVESSARCEQIARYFERVANPPLRTGEHVPRDPSFLKMLIERSDPLLTEAIGRIYRVYCLSPFPDINLMWSHYTRGHTGVCLQFATTTSVFAMAQKVIYTKELPHYSVDDNEGQAHTMLQTKSNDWEYEQEYRIIARVAEASESRDHPDLLVTRNNFLQIDSHCLTSIIIGCRGPVGEIEELVSKHAPGLSVKVAIKSPHSYRVII